MNSQRKPMPFSDDRDVALSALRSITTEKIALSLLAVIEAARVQKEDINGSWQAAPNDHRSAAGVPGAQPDAETGGTAGASSTRSGAGEDSLVSVPDQITPLVGWRAWKIVPERSGSGDPSLLSLHFDEPWQPRQPVVAACEEPKRRHAPPSCACPPEAAPATNCRCGIYAARGLDRIAFYVNGSPIPERGATLVIGRVALWGRVVEYEDGWRAEYGYPQSFFIPHELRADPRAMQYLASFGVPVLDDSELWAAHGWDRSEITAHERPLEAPIPDAPGLDPDVAARPLPSELGVPARLVAVARRQGVRRLGQLLALSYDDLWRYRGVGPVALEQFRAWRMARGFGDYPAQDARPLR